MHRAALALTVACVCGAGCTAQITTRDAGSDASAGRDAGGDAAADGGAHDGGADGGPMDAFVADAGSDAGGAVDAGPDLALPVSCDRSGPQDCSAFTSMGRCPDGPSVFGADVNAAIDAVIAENPTWFDTVSYPASTPWIDPAHVNDYMQAVTDHLAAVGLCASGPGEELGVKRNNDCSESWDLVANPDATTNLVRRHYVGDCFPSFF